MSKRKAIRAQATRDQLLGGNSKPKRIPPRWREYYQKLLEAREMLFKQQQELAKPGERERIGTGMHMADAGTDAFDQDLALGILSSDRDTLFQIDRALERIRNGTYGVCELTGKKISATRLAAVPWTRFSTDAERQLEKEGQLSRARLPDHAEGLPQEIPGEEEEEEKE